MQQKSCSNCSQLAQFSIVVVLSSVGISPRVQKFSHAVASCSDCLRELCETEHLCSAELRNAVNSALTALNLRSSKQSNATNSEKASSSVGTLRRASRA